MEFIYNETLFFLFIFLRISGIFIMTPFFGSNNINRRIKLFFILSIVFVIYPVVPKDETILKNLSYFTFSGIVLREVLVGVIIGFFYTLLFTIAQMSSHIYSMDMGFGMVSVFDPMSQVQIPVLGQMKYFFMVAVFFILGIHRNIIYAIVLSFDKFKIGTLSYNYTNLTNEVIKNFIYYFEIALKLAIPIIAVLFLIDVVLGVMARIAPQMNVFFIGMPLKILAGLMALITITPYFMTYFKFILEEGNKRMLHLLEVVLR